MDETSITHHIRDAFPDVDVVVAAQENDAPEASWGDTFFFYGTERKYPMPFATIVTKDYAGHDTVSNLNRPEVFRLNIGISKEGYRELFGEADSEHDFAALDRVMPHPLYGAQSWICVLNPSDHTFAQLRPLLAEAYERAVAMTAKRGDS